MTSIADLGKVFLDRCRTINPAIWENAATHEAVKKAKFFMGVASARIRWFKDER